MEGAAREAGFSLTFLNSYNDLEVEKKDLMALMQMWVDGIILDSCVEEDYKESYISFLKTASVSNGRYTPIVMLERNFSEGGFSSVHIDYYASAYEATKHIVDIGKRQIVHYTARVRWDMLLDRCRGYVQAMMDHGLSENILIKKCDLSAEDGYNMTREMIQNGQKFDAIFTANDQLAVGTIKALEEANLSIPDDVAVVGFDNIAVSSLITPSLTTVDVPRFTMGHRAMEILAAIIEGNNGLELSNVLESKLIVRASTDKSVDGTYDFREI